MSHEARDKCIGGSEQHRREHGHLTIGMVGVQYGAHGSERYVSGTSDSEQYGSEKDDNSEHNKIYALIRGDTTLSWILTWCCNKCCGGGFSDSLGEGRKARAGHKRAGEGHRCIVVMYSVSSELSGTLLWLESGVVRRGESQNAATRYEARAEDSSYTDITVRRVLEWCRRFLNLKDAVSYQHVWPTMDGFAGGGRNQESRWHLRSCQDDLERGSLTEGRSDTLIGSIGEILNLDNMRIQLSPFVEHIMVGCGLRNTTRVVLSRRSGESSREGSKLVKGGDFTAGLLGIVDRIISDNDTHDDWKLVLNRLKVWREVQACGWCQGEGNINTQRKKVMLTALTEIVLLVYLMQSLENTGIFDDAYDGRKVGTEANLNNLETTMNVSPIPTTRIHNDHPKDQIIGDINSATQTRRMTKISEEHAMDLLQFKLQKVWTLVDLPKGKRAIRTKWVYKNKKVKRGIVVRNKARQDAQGTDIANITRKEPKLGKNEHEKERVHKSRELSSYGQQKSTLVNNGQLTKGQNP
ncbi:putative ribonuclease H-like domain-containing protein [Tanacetum coccineum]